MNKLTHIRLPIAALLIIFGIGIGVAAMADDATPKRATDWQLPKYLPSMDTLKGSVRVADVAPTSKVLCRYTYSTGGGGVAVCAADAADSSLYAIRVPGIDKPALGEVVLRFEIVSEKGGVVPLGNRVVPMAYSEELDITGNPPIILPFPLAGEGVKVLYEPCCNIFGGVMWVRRIPVNPIEDFEGLPEKLLSDFADIEPDELTRTTAGLHMQMIYYTEEAKRLGVDDVGVYTHGRRGWREMLSYDVDKESGIINFQCPDGGIFVLGESQRAAHSN